MNDEDFSGEFLDNEPELPEKIKKKSDPKLSILMLQLTACLVLAAAAVCIRFFGGELFGQLREKYISMFEDTTTVEEVMKIAAGQTGNLSSLSPNGEGGIDVSVPAEASSDLPDTESDISSAASETDDTQSAEYESTSSEKISSSETSSEEGGSAESAETSDSTENNSLRTVTASEAGRSLNLASAYNSFCLPVAGTVSSEYGWRVNPVTSLYSFHSGVDLAADTGTRVAAALGGVVTEVSRDDGYGISVELSHAGEIKTFYAHLNSADVTKGQMVNRGEKIGSAGSTGRSTGPHLHFEVRTETGTLNPRFLMPAVYLS